MRWAVWPCSPLCCQPNSNQNFCTFPMLTELVLNTLPMLQEKGTACFKKLLSRSQCVSMLYYSGIFPMWQAQRVCSQLLCPLCDSGTEHPSPIAAWLLSARGRCSSAPQAVGTAALWLLGTPQCVTLPAQHQSPLVLWGSAKQTQLENTAESPYTAEKSLHRALCREIALLL